MGLRSELDKFLMGLQAAQQGFQSGAQAFQRMGQDEAKAKFQQRLMEIGPAAIKGDTAAQGELLQLGSASGMDLNQTFGMLVQMQPKQVQQPIGLERADVLLKEFEKKPDIVKVQRDIISKLTEGEAQKSIRSLRSQLVNEQRQGQQAAAEGRRQAESIESKLDDPKKLLSNVDQQAREFKTALEVAQSSLTGNSALDENIVFNFIARNVSGEKGPLSDSDIARVKPKTFQGTVQEFRAYLSGVPVERWTPEEREAAKAMFKRAQEKKETGFKERKKEILKSFFAGPITTSKEGEAAFRQLAKQHGLDIEVKDGAMNVVTPMSEEQSKKLKEAQPVLEELKQVDPGEHAKIMAAVQSGRTISPEKLKAKVEALKKQKAAAGVK